MNVRIMHPRRCGGHAVIFWLMRSSGSYAFFNSLPLKSKTPKPPRETSSDLPENFFWSHEDPNRGTPLSIAASSHLVEWLPSPDKTVFILRDFYNYAASKIKTAQKRDTSFSSAWRAGDRKVWIEFAMLAMKQPEKFILFNRWLTEEDYRKEVAGRFGWEAAEYRQEISEYGGGSSFTGVKPIEDTSVLLNRYSEMLDEVTEVANDRVHCLNEQLFGWRI